VTTVIAAYTSEGCVGRCDARCHDAESPVCTCICGGRLHGVGSANATRINTEDLLGQESLEAFAEAHDLDVSELAVSRRLPLDDVEIAA
jgi:hypothetical protein